MSATIREFAPAPALDGVVVRAADFHERGAPVRRLEKPLVGAVLLVSLGPDLEVDGRATGSFAAGLWDRPISTGHFGEQAGYMLYLEPAGAERLLGVPMAELTNELAPLDALLGRFAGELAERLAQAPGPVARHAIAQRLLAARLADGPGPSAEVRWVLDRLRRSRGNARVEALADELGWSRRHLSARFRAQVGLAPKAVARIVRAERAAHLIDAGRPLAEVAYDCGYADQPHLNRDFRALVGCTPGEFPSVQDRPAAA